MTLDEFRAEMEAYRRNVDDDARSLKDSQMTLEKLHDLYRKFDGSERPLANQVIGEWSLSEDENLRYDALVLIRDFKIDATLPALRALASRLSMRSDPGAPYELEKVQKIISMLES